MENHYFAYFPNAIVTSIEDDIVIGLTARPVGYYSHPDIVGQSAWVAYDRDSLLRYIAWPVMTSRDMYQEPPGTTEEHELRVEAHLLAIATVFDNIAQATLDEATIAHLEHQPC